MSDVKSCSNKKCKQENPQPKENFAKHKHAYDQLQWWCKFCFKELSKERTFDKDPYLKKKKCKTCNKIKPVDYFGKNTKIKDGYDYRCKACRKGRRQQRVFKPNENLSMIECPVCRKSKEPTKFSYNKRNPSGYNWECKNCAGIRARESRYNITQNQIAEMLNKQNGRCLICDRLEDAFKKKLSIDHDHKCCNGDFSCGNCVRGLLCGICNRVLAWYEQHDANIRKYLKEEK